MSTNQPPYVIGSFNLQPSKAISPSAAAKGFTPFSTNQPPRPSSQQHLLALGTGAALASMDFWRLRFQWEAGAIAPLNLRRNAVPTVTVSQQQKDDLAQLKGQSRDVMLMLATADFWATTRVAGTAWDDRTGVQPCTLSLEPTTPPARSWSDTLGPVSAASYRQAVSALASKVDPGQLPVALAQAESPQLWLALALGMMDDPGRRPYTCLVIDTVQAAVTVAIQRLKQVTQVPRPNDSGAFAGIQVQPQIPMPGFTAYPGGHAALMHALAVVLGHVTDADSTSRDEMHAVAAAIAANREAMGLHTSFDTAAGERLGRAYGNWMVQAIQHPDYRPWGAIAGEASTEWP